MRGRDVRPARPVSACFGGGGFLAMAFALGVADALADAGVPVHEGPMLGTSGGAWAAAAAALGLPLAGLVDAAATGKRSGVAQPELTRQVFGDSRDRRVRATAVDRRSGRLRILRAEQLGVADVVGASSSAPGLFPPYALEGRRYIDGGVYSPTAAHLAPASQLLVVAAPMAGAVLGPMGRWYSRVLDAELLLWRRRTGGQVLCIRPDRRFTAAVGGGMRCLLDPDRTPLVYDAARALASARLKQLPRRSSTRAA
jgi:hypothetical protein